MAVFGNELLEDKIEFESLVFNAAKDGKLCMLELLEHEPKKEVEMNVSAHTGGATPLLMACLNGHLDVAIYLIEKCYANIEQVGTVIFDGETIVGAPPLWCAATAGHLNIVKMLVKHNASVNSTTKTNSTALRAACFDGHFEIAQYLIQHGADIEIANEYGHTSLMISCFKGHYEIAKYLLDCGADINRKNYKGNTALHNCAESGSLEVLKMLLHHGASNDADTYGVVTPLLSAALTGQASIVEFFVKEYNCTKQEKVNALELLGATFVDKKGDMLTAEKFWRQAMHLRYEDRAFQLGKPYKSSIASYVDAAEVRTFDQLEELFADPDKMMAQALLVRERILGPEHPDTVYYVSYAQYADSGNFERCIQLWMYVLDVQQVQEPLSPKTQNSLLSFTELFSLMMSEDTEGLPDGFSTVSFRDVLRVFRRTVAEIETALSQQRDQDLSRTDEFHCTLIIAMHLICLMCRLQLNLDHNDEMAL